MLKFLGASVSYERLVVIIGGLLLIAGLFIFIRHTKAGKAIRAVEQDREAAILHGIEITKICRLVFIVSFALSAAAAFLVSPMLVIDPNYRAYAPSQGAGHYRPGRHGECHRNPGGGVHHRVHRKHCRQVFDPTIASIASFVILMGILLVRPSGLLPYRM